jgi:hypothetical protein
VVRRRRTLGADLVAWPQGPQLLYVYSDAGTEVSVDGAEADDEPRRVQLRRPLLAVDP